MEKKTIDSVSLVRKIRDRDNKRLKDKSYDEIIKYYSDNSLLLRKKLQTKYNTKKGKQIRTKVENS